MESVRFNGPFLEEPAYLEEVLLEGTLEDWRKIYEEIADRPFGRTAMALKQVLSSSRHYGVSPLWKGILGNLQGSSS